jgi:hypothetical protein
MEWLLVNSLTSRTAVVRTRMPGGVTGKAREGIPMSILIINTAAGGLVIPIIRQSVGEGVSVCKSIKVQYGKLDILA